MTTNIKEYRLNEMFIVRCYIRPDNYVVEVLVDVGRFMDTLEEFKTSDKDKANAFFKKMVDKYRRCDDIIIDDDEMEKLRGKHDR